MIDAGMAVETKTRRARTSWDDAGLAGRAHRVIRSKNLSLLLYAEAFMWFHKIADFRAAETQLLYQSKPGKELRSQHRRIVANLIAQGREIIRRIHSNGGLIKPANGFSLADIQSAIEELENTQLQWNGTMTSSRKEEILKHIFDAT